MSDKTTFSTVYFGEAEAPAHYKITGFANLIPVEVAFEENGEARTAIFHMDYLTNQLRFPEGFATEDADRFRSKVLDHLKVRQAQHLEPAPEADYAGIAGAKKLAGKTRIPPEQQTDGKH